MRNVAAVTNRQFSRIDVFATYCIQNLVLLPFLSIDNKMTSENVKKLEEILKKAEKLNIDIQKLDAVQKRSWLQIKNWKITLCLTFGCVFIALLYHRKLFSDNKCLISMPNTLSHAFRSPENCNFCRNVTQVMRVANISPDEFETNFAYNGKPVIVTDATVNWTATEVFDFWYFKDVYAQSDEEQMNCQFFPYKTEFHSLREALSIPADRVNYKPGTKPW